LNLPYKIISPTAPAAPIILSVPHCGVEFPDDIKQDYQPALIGDLDDTDWFVHQLYDFVPTLGITMIHAVNSRWVIDLNRDPTSKPLYTDGRIITGLCPTTDFLGNPLYKDLRTDVDPAEIKRRLDHYYYPYHQKIEELLHDTKEKFGKALLWDCHSIREFVRTIQIDRFPDLILGDVDNTSANKALSETTLKSLRKSNYTVNHNHPFKGGHITRHFGKPSENIHALQLEMTKVSYMDDDERNYNGQRASKMRAVLKSTLKSLIRQLT
jgi:N-formylglutamate amidohydrolase